MNEAEIPPAERYSTATTNLSKRSWDNSLYIGRMIPKHTCIGELPPSFLAFSLIEDVRNTTSKFTDFRRPDLSRNWSPAHRPALNIAMPLKPGARRHTSRMCFVLLELCQNSGSRCRKPGKGRKKLVTFMKKPDNWLPQNKACMLPRDA